MAQTSNLVKRPFFYATVALLTFIAFSEIKKGKPGSRRSILKYDGISVYQGIINAYRSPARWSTGAFLIVIAVAAGIGIIFYFDEQLSRWFTRQDERAFPVLKNFGWYYGSPENHYAINGGFYLYGLITKNEPVRKTGVLLITSTIAAGLLQTVAKVIIGRARPLKKEGKASFKSFSKENSYYSFPSGHSILSFTTAYAIGKQFRNPSFKMIMYVFGSIAPFSRLWAGAHWVSDAATSISLSIPIVNKVDNFLKDKRNYPSGLD